MNRTYILAVTTLALLACPAEAKQRKIIDPLAPDIVDNCHVEAVDIVAEGKAAEQLAHFDEKAAEKAAADHTAAPDAPKSKYSELPFKQMFPLVISDVTREWGLTKARPIKLTVTIDTIKTANAAMAILISSSSDELAGVVDVTDAQTGAKLGSFYIDVLNSHGGWLGMMMRGGGIREKLSEEFALETSRMLTGRKSKTPRT